MVSRRHMETTLNCLRRISIQRNLASARNFAIAFFWNVFSQPYLTKFVLLDNTHFKRKRSHKIERSLNCTEWKSALRLRSWIAVDVVLHAFLTQSYILLKRKHSQNTHSLTVSVWSLTVFCDNSWTLIDSHPSLTSHYRVYVQSAALHGKYLIYRLVVLRVHNPHVLGVWCRGCIAKKYFMKFSLI